MKELEIGKILVLELETMKQLESILLTWTLLLDLDMRLSKNKTIDKNIQEQINKEKDHWKNVLLRIIVVVNNLGKNNLAFWEKNEKDLWRK